MLGNDVEHLRRHLDLRQGRAERAGRRRLPDDQDLGRHRRRHADRLNRGLIEWPSYDLDGLIELGAERGRARARAPAPTWPRRPSARARSSRRRCGWASPSWSRRPARKSLGLRVMRGQQVAVTSTSDLSPTRARALRRGRARAREARRSPTRSRARPMPKLLSKRARAPRPRAVRRLRSIRSTPRARSTWPSAPSAPRSSSDTRLTNSEGATVSRQSGASALVTSGGFAAALRGTYASIVVNPVADDEGGKKRSGYYWTRAATSTSSRAPESVGEEAARRTLAKLGARKVDTQEVAVVFDPDAARSILGLLAGCIIGGAVWRKSSYLAEREGRQHRERARHDRRRPAPAARARLAAVRRRGPARRAATSSSKRRARRRSCSTATARASCTSRAPRARRAASSGGVGASTSNFILQPGQLERQGSCSRTPSARSTSPT